MASEIESLPPSGVFEITASQVPEQAPVYALDLEGVLNKQTLFRCLVTAFNFPDYFGNNWDAAYDCLLDSLEQSDHPTNIYFSIDENTQIAEQDFLTFTTLLQDACEHLKQRQKAIRFLIATAST